MLMLVLSGCIPTIIRPVVQAPRFSVQAQGVTSLNFQPPIPLVSDGGITIRLPLQVFNPNNFDVTLNRVDFDLFVNSSLAIDSSFTDGIQLVAQGSASLVLDVRIPLIRGVALVEDIVAMVSGQATSYRLDGAVTINVLDTVEVFARTTLVSGRIN